jgi:hypothetical protein
MVDHPEAHTHYGCHPAAGPEVPTKTVGLRTLVQERGQPSESCGGQPTWGTRWGAASQRPGTSCAGPGPPVAHGALADAERCGTLPLGPALLLEVPGMEPSGFFPDGKCSVHT